MEKIVKRIVVMGGSFNPPTLAHYKLMKQAIDAIGADCGLFVPVSDAYLKRKMRHAHPPVVLSPDLRIKMLQAMCTDRRMAVCEKDIGTIEARTMPTLMALQEEHPDAALYFVMGADKIDLLAHLADSRGFLRSFRVVLYSRENHEMKQLLQTHEVLAGWQDSIVVLPQPEGTEGISSSLVRERMLKGESSQEMLHPAVWELFKAFTPADFPDTINSFAGEYAFLSNRFPCRLVWQGLTYGSAEAAFQASRCTDEAERKVIAGCSVDKAVQRGKSLMPYPGWEEARLDIMQSILQAKFEQNATLKRNLAETERSLLINGNNKKETFWGVDLYTWQGDNHLGKIIMNIRDKEMKK